jgi:hypothetical protein
MSYAGQKRNPKRKARPAYHHKKLTQLTIATELVACFHSLAQHEWVTNQNGKQVLISYALPCQVKHRSTTKNPVHKDATKRSW